MWQGTAKLLGISLLLTGCVSHVALTQKDRVAPIELHQKNHLNPPASPSVWQALHEPVLNELIDHAYAYANDLKVAKTQYDWAVSQYESAWSSLQMTMSPSVTYSTGNVAHNHVKFPDYSRYSLSSSFTIDLWGAERYALKAQLASVYAHARAFEEQRILLNNAIAHTYLAMLGIQAQESLQQEKLTLLSQQKAYAQSHHHHGLSTSIEVASQTIHHLEGEIHLTQLAHLKELYYRTLAQLTSYPEELLKEKLSRRPLPPLPHVSALTMPLETVRARPDVQFFEYRYLKASMEDIATQRAWYPNVSLSHVLNLFYAPGNYSAQPWSLSALFATKALNPSSMKASDAQAKASVRHAHAEWMRAMEHALHDLHIASSAYHAHEKQWRQEREKTKHLEQKNLLISQRAAHGLTGPMDAITENLALLKQKTQEIDSQIEAYQALSTLYQSLGLS